MVALAEWVRHCRLLTCMLLAAVSNISVLMLSFLGKFLLDFGGCARGCFINLGNMALVHTDISLRW